MVYSFQNEPPHAIYNSLRRKSQQGTKIPCSRLPQDIENEGRRQCTISELSYRFIIASHTWTNKACTAFWVEGRGWHHLRRLKQRIWSNKCMVIAASSTTRFQWTAISNCRWGIPNSHSSRFQCETTTCPKQRGVHTSQSRIVDWSRTAPMRSSIYICNIHVMEVDESLNAMMNKDWFSKRATKKIGQSRTEARI